MMYRWIFTLGFGLMIAPQLRATTSSDFIQWDLRDGGTTLMHGSLYVPAGYDANQSYALVTYLHGAGHASSNGVDLNVNTTQLDTLYAHAQDMGFFLFAPQAPSNNWGTGHTGMAAQLIDQIATTYSINTDRLYITGASMGGGGVYTMVSSNPGKFAAAVPIAGVSPGGIDNGVLADIPMWIFHNEGDQTVSRNNSRNRVNAIRAAKNKAAVTFPLDNDPSNPYYNTGDPFYTDGSTFYEEDLTRYTEYNSVGHVVWPRVYDERATYDWMLSQSLPEPASGAVVVVAGAGLLLRRRR